MITSTLINNVTVASGQNMAVFQFNATTIRFCLQALFTAPQTGSSNLIVRYAMSADVLPNAVSTANRLRHDAKQIYLPAVSLANQPTQLSTPVCRISSGYLYVWTDITSSAGIALTVKCIELDK